MTMALIALAQPAQDHALVLTGVGRFAVFADASTITADDGGVRMRALQVSERGFAVGDVEYWGGWSWWRFDCTAGTADRLDFASVRVGGAEGPATPDAAPPHQISPGGDSAELAAVACAAEAPPADAASVAQAAALGQAMLAGEIDPPL